MRSRPHSISTPIFFAIVAVGLSLALLVGWTLIVVLFMPLAPNIWLLVLGILSFVIVLSVLITFSVRLVKGISERGRQTRFIDSVTHELKSPLASLKLCVETLGRPQLSDEHQRQVRQMMSDDIDRLSGFIDDVLQASRLAHHRDGTNLVDVSLRELVDDVVTNVRRRHKLEGGIAVDVAAEIIVRTDRTALRTVLMNLLDNAVKYSEDAVDVRIMAQYTPPGALHVSVLDHGIGIPQNEVKSIFRRFYRVETESVRSRRGTGLGLFVVDALVRYLGGRIEASSAGVGLGTTFTVHLPSGARASIPPTEVGPLS